MNLKKCELLEVAFFVKRGEGTTRESLMHDRPKFSWREDSWVQERVYQASKKAPSALCAPWQDWGVGIVWLVYIEFSCHDFLVQTEWLHRPENRNNEVETSNAVTSCSQSTSPVHNLNVELALCPSITHHGAHHHKTPLHSQRIRSCVWPILQQQRRRRLQTQVKALLIHWYCNRIS